MEYVFLTVMSLRLYGIKNIGMKVVKTVFLQAEFVSTQDS
ncbi:hypothetical protein LEP1GSC175_1558 [Leptospira santarosai str. HAI821]|nr:hypothetical protein LEP1GSC175_1558 [Leptospira santarosai str. HAI821]